MFVFKEGFNQLPDFVLYPRGWMDALKDLITGSSLRFSSKEFNKRFVVVNAMPDAVRDLFSRESSWTFAWTKRT